MGSNPSLILSGAPSKLRDKLGLDEKLFGAPFEYGQVVVDVERHYAFQSTFGGMLLESRTFVRRR